MTDAGSMADLQIIRDVGTCFDNQLMTDVDGFSDYPITRDPPISRSLAFSVSP
jgi:hypothetical protein